MVENWRWSPAYCCFDSCVDIADVVFCKFGNGVLLDELDYFLEGHQVVLCMEGDVNCRRLAYQFCTARGFDEFV